MFTYTSISLTTKLGIKFPFEGLEIKLIPDEKYASFTYLIFFKIKLII